MADPWAAFPVVGESAKADPWAAFPVVGGSDTKAPEKPATEAPKAVPKDYGFVDYATGSLPFGEEVQAAGGALGRYLNKKLKGEPASLSDAYSEKLAELRSAHEAYAAQKPWTAAGGDLLGGFAFAPARLASGATTVANASFAALPQTAKGAILQGGKQGAIVGGAYGAGSEGDLYERGVEALKSAGIGGGVGLAVPAGTEVLRAFFAGPKSAIAGRVDPRGYGERKAVQALQRDGVDPAEMKAALDAARTGGAPDITLADISGEGAGDLVRAATNIPGPARKEVAKFVNERQADAADRVMQKFNTYWGGKQASPYDEMERLSKARSSMAKPLYDQARARNPVVDTTKAIEAIDDVLTPGGGAAVSSVRQPGELRDGTVSSPLRRIRSWLTTDNQTRVGLTQLHEVKMDLDAMIATARKEKNGTLLYHLKEVRDPLLDAMDAASPEYATARKIWAGEARKMDAIMTGEDFWTMGSDEIARTMGKMNPAEKASFRVGAYKAIMDRLENKGDMSSVYKTMFEKKANRKRLQALFDSPEQFDDFSRFMKAEEQQAATRATAMTGTTTARQQQGIADAGMDAAVQFAETSVNSSLTKATLDAIGRSLSKLGGWNEQSAAETARILLSTDPAVQQRIIAQLSKRVQEGAIPAPFLRQVLVVTGAQSGVKDIPVPLR